jgi:hypothetical protein
MSFKVPCAFSLGGSRITVEEKEQVDNDPSCDGLAIYGKLLVQLRSGLSGDYRDYVFLHEMVHHILNQMQSKKNEEVFVCQFATFLHQALKTMEYSDDERK